MTNKENNKASPKGLPWWLAWFACMMVVRLAATEFLLPEDLDQQIVLVQQAGVCGIPQTTDLSALQHGLRDRAKELHPDKPGTAAAHAKWPGCGMTEVGLALKKMKVRG